MNPSGHLLDPGVYLLLYVLTSVFVPNMFDRLENRIHTLHYKIHEEHRLDNTMHTSDATICEIPIVFMYL